MERHIVALSGGKDSTAMALRLAEVEPRQYEYVITPTGDELPEMFAHWLRLEALLGQPMKPLTCGQSLQGIIRQQKALPNSRMRFCTRILKIEPFQKYILAGLNQGDDVTVYVGLRADEPESERGGADYGAMPVKRRFPLREWGWGISEVWDYLDRRGVIIPARTDCARCFFQTLPEWYTLWLEHPDIYADAEGNEAAIGHTFRSASRDTWPAGLAALRRRFEEGRVPRGVTASWSLLDRPQMCRVCSL